MAKKMTPEWYEHYKRVFDEVYHTPAYDGKKFQRLHYELKSMGLEGLPWWKRHPKACTVIPVVLGSISIALFALSLILQISRLL